MDNKMKMDGDSQFFSYYNNTRRDIEPLLPDVLPSVLEIGCGAGETMKWLRSIRTVHYAAGVELSPDAASVAQSVFDTIEIADIRSARLEFERGRFAAVLALDVLEHLPDPSAVVHRLKHKIAPDGVFIASIPNISHYTVSFPLFFNGSWDYTERGLLDKTHLQFFTRKSVIRLFEGAGFEVLQIKIIQRGPDFLGLKSHRSRTVRWYANRLGSCVFRWPRHLFDFQFLIAARPVLGDK